MNARSSSISDPSLMPKKKPSVNGRVLCAIAGSYLFNCSRLRQEFDPRYASIVGGCVPVRSGSRSCCDVWVKYFWPGPCAGFWSCEARVRQRCSDLQTDSEMSTKHSNQRSAISTAASPPRSSRSRTGRTAMDQAVDHRRCDSRGQPATAPQLANPTPGSTFCSLVRSHRAALHNRGG